eukprot:CAMPEP_0194350252 /NCGR_PEP_ID=MMETSP0171-20130528/107537_1 /TAXON_ID=218684 /ORGANISM="Corethron pennatum, Strain L29A3" /LENGTH=94 /DNA_ID=CAMNT_0039117781 /DNA_START=405 /DNA_END=686 /DNA_ORIENTATION=+
MRPEYATFVAALSVVAALHDHTTAQLQYDPFQCFSRTKNESVSDVVQRASDGVDRRKGIVPDGLSIGALDGLLHHLRTFVERAPTVGGPRAPAV